MRRIIKFNFPLPSTILLFIVMLQVIAIPGFRTMRGVLIATLSGYLLFMMFVNRGPIHWAHVLWTLGFYVLSELSQMWAILPQGGELIVSNVMYTMVLNWSFGEYIYQGKRSFEHTTTVLATIGAILAVNFLMNATVVDGRYRTDGNANNVGLNCAYLFGFMMYTSKANGWKKVPLNVLMGATAVIAVLSGSRKALLMLIMFMAAFFFFWKPEKNMGRFLKRMIIMVSVVSVIILLVMKVDILYESVGNRLESLYYQWVEGEDVDASATTREKMAEIAMKMFSFRPLYGSGHNTFKFYGGYMTYSHNNYTEILVSLGIIGIVVYYLPLIYFTYQAFKLWRKEVPGAILPLSIFLIQFINDVGLVSYYTFYIHMYLGIAVGYVYLMKKQLREQTAGEDVLWDTQGRRLSRK